MEPQSSKNLWVLARKAIVVDGQQVKKGTIGRLLRHDGWLLVIDFLGRRIAAKPSDIICLNGE